MEEVGMWIVLGIICAAVLGIIIAFLVKLFKSSPDERKKMILDFLIDLVGLAKEGLDSKEAEEKIEEIENQFKEKASWFLKIVLLVTRKANLKELVQEALDTVEKMGEQVTDEETDTEDKED